MLPAGDQIYNVTTSPNRTEEAPSRVLAFTQGQTAVWVEGVLKFRFNTAGTWPAAGTRSTGCRPRRTATSASRFGAGSNRSRPDGSASSRRRTATRCGQVFHDGSSAWAWRQLAYGSDPAVKATAASEPISVGYGEHIGAMFTRYLDLKPGRPQPGLTGPGTEHGCPPMYFQILSVYPRDPLLAKEHDKLKQLDAQLTRQAAKLKAMNRSVAIASAKAQRKVLLPGSAWTATAIRRRSSSRAARRRRSSAL